MGVMESIYLASCLVIYFVEEHPHFGPAISKAIESQCKRAILHFTTG